MIEQISTSMFGVRLQAKRSVLGASVMALCTIVGLQWVQAGTTGEMLDGSAADLCAAEAI